MKKIIPVLLVIAAITACKNNKTKSDSSVTTVPPVPVDSFLVTDSSWGLITAASGIDDLHAVYGHSNLIDERICGAECIDSVDVTFLYRGKKEEATIYWKDSAYHRVIRFIESYGDNSSWHTATGIQLGSGFSELLKLNGKKISFFGFGWDYGGSINSYNGGALENSSVHFGLDITEYNNNGLFGDQELDSDMPAVKEAMGKIKIRQIALSLNKN